MNTHILFEANKVHVFSLPQDDFLKSASWEGNYIWSGHLKFIREGTNFFVRLLEKDSTELFGECPIREEQQQSSSSSSNSKTESVQPATDSTRAFVLRVEDGDQFSYVGLMFDDRSVAYNFSSSLIHRRKGVGPAPVLPVQDHTLDQGEAITIDLFNKVKAPAAGGGRPESGESAAVAGGHQLTNAPGEVPRVTLESLKVSTAGKSRRVKTGDVSAATAEGAAAAAAASGDAMNDGSAAAAAATKKAAAGIDDIFSGGGGDSSSSAQKPPVGVDDVFGGPAQAAAAPQTQKQKDVLDSLFG